MLHRGTTLIEAMKPLVHLMLARVPLFYYIQKRLIIHGPGALSESVS
jgi:hypothetical protein